MKILIANRGEIARRILRTCHAMGHRTVAVYSEADAGAPYVAEADEAVCIGPPPSAESYLDVEALIAAARRTGTDAVHPGYGFLAENAPFAEACEAAGLVFIGPTPDSIRRMGSKIEAKRLMAEHDVPVVPGYQGDDQSDRTLHQEALGVGFPVLLKASAGGGGKGMRIVRREAELDAAIAAARREAQNAFGDATLLIERYVERPRHVEFQILGDGRGKVLHVFERECSIQRRHQKIIEEAPSVLLERNPELRERMARAAVKAGAALDYRSAGTVEFIVEPDGRAFYFLEVNTRLQVEHPVTEETTGLDLVALQIAIAQGDALALEQADIVQRGHSIEVRIYAEDPANNFLPSTGRLVDWHLPVTQPGVRVDSGVETGSEVSVHYDPMLAKVITAAPTRGEATQRMIRALEESSIQGVTTNRSFLIDLLRTQAWQTGDIDTHLIERHPELTRHAIAEPVVQTAATAATLATALQRHREREGAPGLALRPGWRNNAWRGQELVWDLDRSADGAALEVRYTARDTQARRFTVTLGDEAARERAFAQWLRARYDSDEALREAWAQDKRTGLSEGEGLETRVEPIAEPLLATGKHSNQRKADTREFARAAERTAVVHGFDGTWLRLELDGHTTQWRVTLDHDADGRQRAWVHGLGESLALVAHERLPSAQEEGVVGGSTAPMPGKVLQVLVSAGQAIAAGDAMVILEAMKMEMTVYADADGTVEDVFVEPGDQVEAGAALVKMA